MGFSYEDVGEFGDRRAAEDWARRNNIDPRDLHYRDTARGVEVGLRKNTRNRDDRFNDRYGGRKDGFWR